MPQVHHRLLRAFTPTELPLAGLPVAAARVIRSSLSAGIAVATHLRSVALLGAVRRAFVEGMDVALVVAAAIAVVGLLLALVFMPRRSGTAGTLDAERADTSGTVATTAQTESERPEVVAASHAHPVELPYEEPALRG